MHDPTGPGPAGDQRLRDALEDLVDGFGPGGPDHGGRPSVQALADRVRRRRVRRRSAVAGVVASVIVLAVLGVLAATPGPIRVDTPPADDTGDPVAPRHWQWHDVDGVIGRDGSASGYALARDADSTSLVIVLGDGVPCLDATSCAGSPEAFGSEDLAELARSPGSGALDPAVLALPGSPFATANLVWVPQVTGDMHLGGRPDATVEGLEGTQHFVGAGNFRAVVGHLAGFDWTADLDRVVLAGSGTGGFGALGNYQVLRDSLEGVGAPGGISTALVVDSANWFGTGEVLRRCEANTWIRSWDLKRPPQWPEDLASGPETLGNTYAYLARRYPDDDLVWLSAPLDRALLGMYQRRSPGCGPGGPPGEGDYEAAVRQLASELATLRPWRVSLSEHPQDQRPLTVALGNPTGAATATTRELLRRTIER